MDRVFTEKVFFELWSYVLFAVVRMGKHDDEQYYGDVGQQVLGVKNVQKYDEESKEIVRKHRVLVSENEQIYTDEPLEVEDEHLHPRKNQISILNTKSLLLFSIFNDILVKISYKHSFSSC